MKEPLTKPNRHEYREAWLKAGADQLREYFTSCKVILPEKIRYAIAFPSTGVKGKRVGECWHSSSSDGSTFEIFIRADLSDPVEVLSILVKELVHAALAPGSGHGKEFKSAAIKLGLLPPLRKAAPGVLLLGRLNEIAATLGPLPHESLHFERGPLTAVSVAVDRPKKQRARMLKAECPKCAKGDKPYLVRISASTARDIGPPHCPLHGAMEVEQGGQEAEEQEHGEAN